MEIKSFTYKRLLGKLSTTYYLQRWLSRKRMDEHIAEMLADGWTIMSAPVGIVGDGRTLGLFIKHDIIIITYKKE